MQRLATILALLLAVVYCQAQAFGRWPGTKWCGVSDDATDFDDLADGMHRETDVCCRAHDHCDRQIAPFQFKYNTFNWSLYTMLGCGCDKAYYQCLKHLGEEDPVANGVGGFYFNKLAKKCFTDQGQQLSVPSWEAGEWTNNVVG